MTEYEQAAKTEIINKLREEGYATYANIFDLFDLNLTEDPKTVAYMLPGKAKIVVNKNLSIDQVSTIVRHEILHEYLTHAERELAYDTQHKLEPGHNIANIAGDYEISNRGYTKKDKNIVRAIKLGNQVLKGLVTEDQYPGWENMSFEDMYAKLRAMSAEEQAALQPAMRDLDISDAAGELTDIQDDIQDAKDAAATDKQLQGIEKAADKTAAQLKDIQNSQKGKQSIFPSKNTQKEQEELKSRIKAIKKALSDLQIKRDLFDEVTAKKDQERVDKARRQDDRYRHSGIVRFKDSLAAFIKDQIGPDRAQTWSRINPRFVNSPIIRKGISNIADAKIPSVNVYFDVSGSFDDPQKTAAARSALQVFDQYVKKDKLVVNLYYFADTVASTPEKAGGGTSGQPILDHIEATHPTNVIILTDSDISDCKSSVVVPGAVWLLFYDAESSNLITHIKGRQQTSVYDIEY